MFSIYNAGGLFGHRYRYEGTAFGGGLSAGLVRPLSRRWNLEFELGLGVVWADWERLPLRELAVSVPARAPVSM